ncbi:uncharacterized protein [Asterias amurensis]|uniref:uncharacterized protein n=1 Tax=Asterias amurensis TaxID=7602 RepID=UPI003AB727F1
MSDTDSYIWKNIFPQSPRHRPCHRSKQAACHYEGQIYIHGGRDGHQTLKDFWRYDIGSNTWTKMECGGDRPPPLQEHTMIAQRGCLFIFGGELGYGSFGETPLWIYSISRQTWEKPVIESEVKTPIGVRGHTAVVWHGGMHVYGGYVDLKGSSSELWTLDFETRWWHLSVDAQGENSPPPRHCHSAVVHESSMWVYGGLNNLQPLRDLWKWSFESRVWTRVKSNGSPGSLYGHSAVRVANSMMIFGGEGKEDYKNELWKFNFDATSWHNATPNRKITPTPCTRHVMLSIPNFTHATYLNVPSLGDFRPHSAPNRAYPDRNQGGVALTPIGHIANLFVMRPHSSPPCVAGSSHEQKDSGLSHRFRNRIQPSPTNIGTKRELFKKQDDTNSVLKTEGEELVAMATDDARIYSDPKAKENGRWAITSPVAAPNEYQVQQEETSHLLINEESPIHHRQDGRWADQDELADTLPHLLQGDEEWILEDFSEPNSPVATRRPSENLTLTLTSDTSFDILCTSNPLECIDGLHIDSDRILCNNVSSLSTNNTSLPSNSTSYSNSLHQRLNNNDLCVHAECNTSLKDNNIYNCYSLINTKNVELPSILEPERKEDISEKIPPHIEEDIINVKPIQENLPEKEEGSSEKQELLTSQTNLLSSYVNVGYESSREDISESLSSSGVQDKQSGVTLYNQNRLVRDNAFDHSQSPTLDERDGQLSSAHPPTNQSQGRLYKTRRPSTLLDQKQGFKDQWSSTTNGRRDSKPRLHGRSQTLNSLSYRQNDHEMPRDTTSLLVKEDEEDPPVEEYEEELEVWHWPVFLYLMGGEETGSCSLHQNTSPMSVWKCCIAQGKLTDSEIQQVLSQY